MGKTAKQHLQSQRVKDHDTYQRFQGSRNEGQGFASVRKCQAVSRYYRDFAKEKVNLKEWTDKLQKIYAENDDSNDDDELVKVHSKRTSGVLAPIKSKSPKVKYDTKQPDAVEGLNNDKQIKSTVTSHNVPHSSSSSDGQLNGPKRFNKKLKVSSYFKEEQEWKKKAEEKEMRLKEIESKKEAKEAAVAKYRQEKIQHHKLLAKRNYKGQPNMATRMELLLEKIVKKTS